MATTNAMKAECLLRAACTLLSSAAALLLRFSAQTKAVLLVERTAVARDVQALWVLVMATGAAAGYQLLQLLRCFYFSRFAEDHGRSSKTLAWTCFLLDKGCTYVVFAATIAALQACVVALDGVRALQWSKLCGVYTRFCDQVAGSLLCSLVASASMAAVSAFSACRLFRLYPSAGSGGGGGGGRGCRSWVPF